MAKPSKGHAKGTSVISATNRIGSKKEVSVALANRRLLVRSDIRQLRADSYVPPERLRVPFTF